MSAGELNILRKMSRREQVYNFIRDFMRVNKYAPSQQEIAESLGVDSTFGIRKHLEALEKDGKIKRFGNRAIQIIQ